MYVNMKENDNTILSPSFMPDDGRPAPELLTESEAITFLRLDIDGPEKPSQTLLYYRKKALLRATRVGKKLRYQRKELLKLLDLLTERTQKDVG